MKPITNILRRLLLAATLLVVSPFALAQEVPADTLTVQEIQCTGNTQISCEFIRGNLYLEPGQVLDEEEVRNAQLRLSSLRNFKSVSIRLEKGAQRGAVIVVIDVQEANAVITEWIMGASLHPDVQVGSILARFSNQNLFGKGEVGEIRAQAHAPFARDGASAEGYNLSFWYADPQLLGSRRYFANASAGFARSRFVDIDGNFSDFEAAVVSVAVGRRFGDFSYVMLELDHRPSSDWTFGWWNTDPVFERREFHGRGTKATLLYGWSTEDDPNFPTLGSAMQIAVRRDFGANGPDRYAFIRYRKNWEALDGYLSFKLGGDQLLSLNYSRPIAPGESIERGRWYVEPGIISLSTSSLGETRVGYGLKAGFRAETRQFGLIDLYVTGVAESVR
jgi:outer membrane protein assembly factor BamA